ncbi:hypothetical protein FBQ96_06470 [Nitrospirales bacterium NOB]|nr:hypothetical protein [Nitrospirales bacterium NOB]
MNTRDLHAIWNAPDNSRLTAKQYTVRLPIRVAAQLAALNEMYPRKTMTNLIGDILAAGLDQLAEDLPTKNVGEKPLGFREDGEAEWEQIGPGVTFAQLSQKYLKQFETEESASKKADKLVKESHNPARTKRGRKSKQ